MVSKFTSLNSEKPSAAYSVAASKMYFFRKSISLLVLIALLTLVWTNANSQCTIMVTNPAVDLPVVGSSATLDAASVAANVTVSGVGCTNFNFYDALGTLIGPSVSVNCDGTLPGPGVYFVSVDDGMPANTSNLVQITVTLDDSTDPSFTAPIDVTISCEQNPDDLLLTGDVSDEADNCALGIQATYSDDLSGLVNCNGTGTIVRTWTLDDGNGNAVSQTQMITIQDVKVPTFTPPANITIDFCTDDINDLGITGDVTNEADNCSTGIEATYTDAPMTAGMCPNSGTVVRTWSLVDDCNNATVLMQTITLQDNVAPTTSQMDITVDNDPGVCNAAITLVLDAGNTSDNCDAFGNLTITSTFSGTADASGSYPVGTTPVIFTITDQCGNATMHTVNVTVNDTNIPVIVNCPADVTLNADISDCDNTYSWTAPTATGFCSGAPLTETIFSDDPNVFVNTGTPGPGRVDFGDFPVGTTAIGYAFIDANGNRDTCRFTISVLDNQPPVISCPPNQTLNFGSCNAANALVPDYRSLSSVLDNCANGHTVTQSPAPNSLLSAVTTPADGETFTVTLTAVDNNPNNLGDVCTFVVTLADTNVPTPDMGGSTLPAATSTCGNLQICAPTATDNCGNLIVGTIVSGGTGTVVGTCTAPCAPSPSISANPAAPLNDNSTTTINIPVSGLDPIVDEVSFSLEIAHTWVGDLSATLTSPSGTTVSLFSQPGSPATNFGLGCDQNNINVTFSDDAVNTAADFENTCNPSASLATYAIQGSFQAIGSLASFQGDNANGTWILNVSDAAAGDIGSLVGFSLDLCTLSGATIPMYEFTPGNYNLVWEYNDGNGNITSQTQILSVANDTELPVLNCADISIDLDENGMATVLPGTILGEGITLTSGGNLSFAPGNSDFCVTAMSATTISFDWNYTSADISALYDPFGYTVNGVFTPLATSNLVTDPASLQQSGTTSVSLLAGQQFCFRASTLDNIPPNAQTTINNFSPGFMGDFDPVNWSAVFTNSNGSASYSPIDATDNCGLDLASILINGGSSLSVDCSDLGVNAVTISINDINGNTGTCTANITVNDVDAPTLIDVPADATLSCNDPLTPAVVTATDNCSSNLVVLMSEVSTKTGNPNTCGNYSYTITRTWTSTDDSGNAAVGTQVISVVDNSAPTSPVYSDNIGAGTIGTDPNNCYAVVNLRLTGLTDCAPFANLSITNDSPFAISNGADASGNYPVGAHNINFTVSDPCGNTISYNRSFNVVDNTGPVAVCKSSITIGLPSSGTLLITPALIDNGSFDNCGTIVSRTVSPNTFDCSDADGITPHPVTLTVMDDAGNTASCNAVVIIEDNINPTALCTNLTVTLDQSGTASITTSDIDGGSFDNCTATNDLVLSISQSTFGIADAGSTVPVTLTVTDSNGNSSTCTAQVTVAVPEACFNVGTAIGGAATVVSVPVSVTNFVNVLSFQFSVALADDQVGEILGISSNILPGTGMIPNPLSTDTLSISYFNNQIPTNPITLADGSVIFFIDILLTGNVGDFSVLSIVTNSMVIPLEVVHDFGAGAFPLTPCTTPGAIAINQPAMLTIAGEILNESGSGVGQVDVTLTSGATTVGTFTTDPVGDFSFSPVSAGGSYLITPYKNINWTNGVTANDLFTIQKHIVGLDTLDSGYKKIAADAFKDGIITTFDIVQLQTLLGSLGTVTPSTTTSWVFAAKIDTLPNLAPLFVPPYTNALLINNLPMDSLRNDFVAIKTGDVTDNANPANLTGNAGDRTEGVLNLVMEDRRIEAGKDYELALTAKEFQDLVAYQWVMEFDPSVLRFEGYNKGALTALGDLNFGQNFVDEGILVMLWHQAVAEQYAADEVLFSLQFKALKDADKLSDLLRVDESKLAAAAYRDGGLPLAINLQFTNSTEKAFALYQNQPNPFKDQTVIGFYLPEASSANLQILDVAGRLLREIPGDYAAGYNEVALFRSELPATGVLYYRLETATEVATMKMILVE